MYFLLGITLIFALLLLLNLAASILANVVWRLVSGRVEKYAPRTRSRLIFALRILPVALSVIFVFGCLVPAYLIYEPAMSNEVVSFKLALLAAISACGIGIALYRVFRTWQATSRLMTDWLSGAEAVEIAGVDIPVYAIEHPFPLIAVVGMIRPRMFVARKIFDILSADEFQAAVVHEQGHLAARDNLKRTTLRVCRDLLVFPFGHTLDRDWAENAEMSADDHAAEAGGNKMALDLAGALIKIARVIPENAYPAMPSASFLIEHNLFGIRSRVRRLLDADSRDLASRRRLPLGWIVIASSLTITAIFAINEAVLFRVHSVMETFVHLLQ